MVASSTDGTLPRRASNLIICSYRSAGYISLLTAGTWISRLLKNQLMDDVFNDENESFMQERRLIANEYSVNLPTRFRYQRKTYSGWIT